MAVHESFGTVVAEIAEVTVAGGNAELCARAPETAARFATSSSR